MKEKNAKTWEDGKFFKNSIIVKIIFCIKLAKVRQCKTRKKNI